VASRSGRTRITGTQEPERGLQPRGLPCLSHRIVGRALCRVPDRGAFVAGKTSTIPMPDLAPRSGQDSLIDGRTSDFRAGWPIAPGPGRRPAGRFAVGTSPHGTTLWAHHTGAQPGKHIPGDQIGSTSPCEPGEGRAPRVGPDRAVRADPPRCGTSSPRCGQAIPGDSGARIPNCCVQLWSSVGIPRFAPGLLPLGLLPTSLLLGGGEPQPQPGQVSDTCPGWGLKSGISQQVTDCGSANCSRSRARAVCSRRLIVPTGVEKSQLICCNDRPSR